MSWESSCGGGQDTYLHGERWSGCCKTSLLSFPAHKACTSSGPWCVCVCARASACACSQAGVGVGHSLAALLSRFRGEEWSMCVLSAVIKGKEIFHWVLGEGLHKCAAGEEGRRQEPGRGRS